MEAMQEVQKLKETKANLEKVKSIRATENGNQVTASIEPTDRVTGTKSDSRDGSPTVPVEEIPGGKNQ
eukprot:1353730-Amorphochlora_amoeboformis.AAC.1